MVCGSAAGFRNRNRIPFRPTDVCRGQYFPFAHARAHTLSRPRFAARVREGRTRARAPRALSITPSLT